MFVHLLVWDERYSGRFLKDLLAALFDIAADCQHVILVVPPRRVTSGDPFYIGLGRPIVERRAARTRQPS